MREMSNASLQDNWRIFFFFFLVDHVLTIKLQQYKSNWCGVRGWCVLQKGMCVFSKYVYLTSDVGKVTRHAKVCISTKIDWSWVVWTPLGSWIHDHTFPKHQWQRGGKPPSVLLKTNLAPISQSVRRGSRGIPTLIWRVGILKDMRVGIISRRNLERGL